MNPSRFKAAMPERMIGWGAFLAVAFLGFSLGEGAAAAEITAEEHQIKASYLKVGEQPRFIHLGGILNFVRVGQYVKFQVNKAAGDRAGIRIGPDVLDLAVEIVNRQPAGRGD